jgi:hypothetical protein
LDTNRQLAFAAAVGILLAVVLTVAVFTLPLDLHGWLDGLSFRAFALVLVWILSILVAILTLRWLIPIHTQRLLRIMWSGGTAVTLTVVAGLGFFDRLRATLKVPDPTIERGVEALKGIEAGVDLKGGGSGWLVGALAIYLVFTFLMFVSCLYFENDRRIPRSYS